MLKTKVEDHFDKVAPTYDMGKQKYSFYYNSLKSLLKDIIGINKFVFEIGCGTGDLLTSLRPKIGYGMDISNQMIDIAKSRHSKDLNLKFSTRWPKRRDVFISKADKNEYIFMSDVIEHLEDIDGIFTKIIEVMGPKTLFINTMANPIWEPLLLIWEKMGLKMKEGPHRRLDYLELKKIMESRGLKVIRHDYKLLVPIYIPLLTDVVNKYFEKYLKQLAFIEYFIAVKR